MSDSKKSCLRVVLWGTIALIYLWVSMCKCPSRLREGTYNPSGYKTKGTLPVFQTCPSRVREGAYSSIRFLYHYIGGGSPAKERSDIHPLRPVQDIPVQPGQSRANTCKGLDMKRFIVDPGRSQPFFNSESAKDCPITQGAPSFSDQNTWYWTSSTGCNPSSRCNRACIERNRVHNRGSMIWQAKGEA